jgi:nucleoside-diphosphate-sugar epimerase
MTVIAVAGGTGGIGRTVIEALVQQSKLQVIVFTRGVWIFPEEHIPLE